MGSTPLKFKRIRLSCTALAASALLLTGCSTVVTGPAESFEQSGGALPTHLVVSTPPANRDTLAQLLDGQFALSYGDVDAAAAAYARASALSDDAEVAGRAARLAIAADDAALARRMLARWRQLGARQSGVALMRARIAVQEKDWSDARRQLDVLVTSGDEDAWRDLGSLLLDVDDVSAAGKLLKQVATPSRLPNDEQAWLAMSELANHLHQYKYARELAQLAVRRFRCADCYAWAAQLADRADDFSQARTLFGHALAKQPDNTQWRMAYAQMLLDHDDGKGALRVLRSGKQDATTYQARAALLQRSHDMKGLQRLYADLQRAPKDVREDSFYLLGQLAGALHRVDAALDWFAKVPYGEPNRFPADTHSVLLLMGAGDVKRARAKLDQMQVEYAGEPGHLARTLALSAQIYMQQKRYGRAAKALSEALASDPDNPTLLYSRGLAYAESRDIDRAVADLRRVLKIEPDNVNVMNALGYTLADANRDLAEARTLLHKAYVARPGNAAIIDSWAWLQYRLGNAQEALKLLRRAWKISGRDPAIGKHLAEVLQHLGHDDQAQAILQQVAQRQAATLPSITGNGRQP